MKLFGTILAVAFSIAAFSAPVQERKLEEKMLAWALIEAAGTQQAMEQTLQAMLNSQMNTATTPPILRQAFEEFLRETISYEALRNDLAEIYLQVYTPDDIRELIRFYQSPIGRKHAAAGAPIATATAALTQKKMEENLPRFQLRIQQLIQTMTPPAEAPALPEKTEE